MNAFLATTLLGGVGGGDDGMNPKPIKKLSLEAVTLEGLFHTVPSSFVFHCSLLHSCFCLVTQSPSPLCLGGAFCDETKTAAWETGGEGDKRTYQLYSLSNIISYDSLNINDHYTLRRGFSQNVRPKFQYFIFFSRRFKAVISFVFYLSIFFFLKCCILMLSFFSSTKKL